MNDTDTPPSDGLLLGSFILAGTAVVNVFGALAGVGVLTILHVRERRLQRQEERRQRETYSEEDVV